MSTYTLNTAQMYAIAKEAFDANLYSGQFESTPFLEILMGMHAREMFGVPDLTKTFGAGNQIPQGMRDQLRGSTFKKLKFNNGTFGGGGAVTERGQTPTVTNTDVITSNAIGWYMHAQPIKIWKHEIEANQSDYGIGQLTIEAVDIAWNEMRENIGSQVLTGAPTSETAGIWDNFNGVADIIEHTTSTTYGSLTKATNGLDAYNNLSAATFGWNLIDTVNKSAAAIKGPGVDLVLVDENLFYDVVLPKARAEGQTTSFDGGAGPMDIPRLGLVGFQRDWVKYGKAHIICDPKMTAQHMYCLVSEDWGIEVHPDHNFSISKFTDRTDEPGQDYAVTGQITLKARMYCKRPWRQGYFDTVT